MEQCCTSEEECGEEISTRVKGQDITVESASSQDILLRESDRLAMENTLFCSALVIAGAIVYLAYGNAGIFLLVAGCALVAVRRLNRMFFKQRR